VTGRPCYLIDAGAVVDARPSALVGYAHLISEFMATVRGVPHPRVGLLSNGEEPGKGNTLARETFELLAADDSINFVGNVEGNVLLRGAVDAVVTDGFSGNIALKSAEGAATLFQETLRRELTRSWWLKLAAVPLRPAFRRAAGRLDYREYGGAPLLGVLGTVFIAHGRSDGRAITNALLAARDAAMVALRPAGPRGPTANDEAAAP
jgi:glycerol-3-phosphate acyltransferase PlsX